MIKVCGSKNQLTQVTDFMKAIGVRFREFDIVTWDRLKRVDVEPEYDVWKEYAFVKGIR